MSEVLMQVGEYSIFIGFSLQVAVCIWGLRKLVYSIKTDDLDWVTEDAFKLPDRINTAGILITILGLISLITAIILT